MRICSRSEARERWPSKHAKCTKSWPWPFRCRNQAVHESTRSRGGTTQEGRAQAFPLRPKAKFQIASWSASRPLSSAIHADLPLFNRQTRLAEADLWPQLASPSPARPTGKFGRRARRCTKLAPGWDAPVGGQVENNLGGAAPKHGAIVSNAGGAGLVCCHLSAVDAWIHYGSCCLTRRHSPTSMLEHTIAWQRARLLMDPPPRPSKSTTVWIADGEAYTRLHKPVPCPFIPSRTLEKQWPNNP